MQQKDFGYSGVSDCRQSIFLLCLQSFYFFHELDLCPAWLENACRTRNEGKATEGRCFLHNGCMPSVLLVSTPYVSVCQQFGHIVAEI